MPSQSDFDSGRRILIAAGTGNFEHPENPNLPGVQSELQRITTIFTALGYRSLQTKIDPNHAELETIFSDASLKSQPEDIVIAYYTSHGCQDPGDLRYYLFTKDSDPNRLHATALAAEDLARALVTKTKASQVLLILDSCYAGQGAVDVTKVVSSLQSKFGNVGLGFFVLAAARPNQEAEEGALCAALEQALANRTERWGGRTQQSFNMEDLNEAIDGYLREYYPAQAAELSIIKLVGACKLFRNPRHHPEIRPGLDLETQRAFDEYRVPITQSEEFGAGGWYFTGREQALRELAAWLGQPSSGGKSRVVTGGPGCGKSAVLARIVALSNMAYRQEALAAASAMSLDLTTLPPEGIATVAVHARRKFLPEVVMQIADAFNLSSRTAPELIETLGRRTEKAVIVVDALDEADDKDKIVSGLLRPLAALPQIFLIIGTRPDSVEHSCRFRALSESAVEIDLDEPRYIGSDDVTRYVERRLLATEEPGRATPYRESPEIVQTVAQAVSRQAKNVFLVAHTAVLALLAKPSVVDVSEPNWIDHLPSGLDEAFSQFLSELHMREPGGLSSAMAQAVLLPLAFAEGEGLPWSNLWAAVASAISGSPILDDDIALVRKYASAFIVEGLENERSVYRLYHERVAEYLRNSVDSRQAQRNFVEALRGRVPAESQTQNLDWKRAHPYILTHLASHALEAGLIDELAADGMFLVAAEPQRTLQALSRSIDPFSRRAYFSYSTAFKYLQDLPEDDRLSYLEMAARQIGDDALAGIWTSHRHSCNWTVPWVQWIPVTPHRAIHVSSRVYSIVFGSLDNRPIIVSGGDDGTVGIWDLATGAQHGEPLCGHEGRVRTVALGALEGRPIIVSGGYDRTVRLWDLATGAPVGEPLRGHAGEVYSVALGALDGQVVAISGSDDCTVRRWDVASGTELGEPLRGHRGRVTAVAVGALGGRSVIISGSGDRTVRLWDLATGDSLGNPGLGHEGVITSIALGELDNCPVLVSSDDERAVRMWNLSTGEPVGKSWLGYKSRVRSVALAALSERTVVVSGSDDRTLRVRDLSTGSPLGEPYRGHEGGVRSIALGTLEDRPVIVSGGEECTIRVWELGAGALLDKQWNCHKSWVRAVTLGKLKGMPVVVSCSDDCTLRVWDLATGAPVGNPLLGHKGKVRSVAVGTLEHQTVIVSGGDDRTVRRWDLATGTALGGPLRGHEGKVRSVALGSLENRQVIVSGGGDSMVRVWDLATGQALGEPLRGHRGEVRAVAVCSLSGRAVVISGSDDCTVQLWDLATGKALAEPLRGHGGWVTSLAVGSLDGQQVIASGSDDCTVRLWDLATGAPVGEPLRGHVGWLRSVALGELNGRPVIISGGDDRTVRVWDARERRSIAIYIGSEIMSIACAKEGTLLVAARSGLMALHFEVH